MSTFDHLDKHEGVKRTLEGDEITMTTRPNTPSAAPVTPERLAELHASQDFGSVSELFQHIDWQAAKIAELTAKGDDATYQRECFDALQLIPTEFVGNDVWHAGIKRMADALADEKLKTNCIAINAKFTREERDALQAKLTAAQSFVPKAVQRLDALWSSPRNEIYWQPNRDGDCVRYTDHAAIVADLTTALNLAKSASVPDTHS